MANQIDSIKDIQKEISVVIGQVKAFETEILSISKATRELSETFKTIKTPKAVNDAINKSNKQVTELTGTVEKQRLAEIKLAKAREKAFDDYEKNLTKQRKMRESQVEKESQLNQRLQKQRESEVLAIQKATQLSKKLGTALAVASRKRNELAQVIQNLNVKRNLGNKLSDVEQKELKQSEIAFKKYDKAVRGAKESVGRFQENVGNYPKGLSASIGALKSLGGALGAVSVGFIAISVVSDAFKRIKSFDKAMQNLSGVLGTNRKSLKDLESQIISVAGKSVKTSNEVANLAESLITLGKTKDEVKELLQPVTDLSLGLNASADEAGEFLVKMLNSFGASTDEAKKYADTIATIRTSTSLDFRQMADAFPYITPVARVLEKDLAQVGAEIGILTDNTIKAENAGRLLASSYQKMAKEGRTMEDALKEINDAQAKGIKGNELLAIATNIFGINSGKIGIILANNTDIIDKNAQAIRDNGGALDKLVKENMKSLEDKIKVLDSSWEELILTIDNGNGSISTFFKGGIDLASRFLRSLSLLEKAQGALNKSGVEGESGWRRFFNGVVPGLKLLDSGYDKALETQKRFIKTNEQLSKLDTKTIEAIERKTVAQYESGKLSEAETKVYKNQINVINDVLKKRYEERVSLISTAKELGYAGEFYDTNGEKLFNYYKTAEEASDRVLKLFIKNNKKIKKETDGTDLGTGGKSKKTKRTKVDALGGSLKSSPFSDEINKQREDELKSTSDFIKAMRDLYKDEESFELPSIDSEAMEKSMERINKKVSDDLVKLFTDDVFKEALRDVSDTVEEYTGVSGDKLNRFFDSLKTNGAASFEELGEIASASFSLMGDVSDAFFQGKIDKYDADIEASNAYYDNLLANENNSAELSKRLQKDKDDAEKRLQAKQNRERKKQFLANKAFAVGEIAVNTAVAVAKVLGQTGIFGLAASIPIIALGAIQTGIVLAQKMPAFAEGGTMQEDGLMKINDHKSGRLEVVERKGKLLMTDKKNAIVDGKKGDVIHKDAQAYFNNLSDDEILNDAKNHTMIATIRHQNNVSNKLSSKKANDVQKTQTDRLIKAIQGKKTQFNVQNNVSLADDLRYINISNQW